MAGSAGPFAALLGAMAAGGGTPAAGPQVATFLSSIDNSDQPYALYVPAAYAANPGANRRFPLVISLHGALSNHRLNLRRVFGEGNRPGETDAEATRVFPPLKAVDYFVASPLARGTMGYRGVAEHDVLSVLEEMKRRFPIDEDRVYLTGLSMGGGGTLEIGLSRPDLWAAIAAVCPVEPWFGGALAANAANLGVHLFHGDADPVVPVSISREWASRFKELGIAAEYQEYSGVQHNAWDRAYAGASIFEWFAKHRRNRFPDRVRFAAAEPRSRRAYWVEIEAKDRRKFPSIDARFTAVNRIELTVENVAAWRLHLAGHPKYDPAKPVEVTVGGRTMTVEPGRQPESGPMPAVRPARMVDVLLRPHVYVYGSQDPAITAELRRLAWEAAAWTGYGGTLLYSPRVVQDRDLAPADLENSNLVLFGTPRSNSIVAKLAAKAPLHVRRGEEHSTGLLYMLAGPRPGQLILVNEGLAFWTGAEESNIGGPPFGATPHRVLCAMPDWFVFSGNLVGLQALGYWEDLPSAPALEGVVKR